MITSTYDMSKSAAELELTGNVDTAECGTYPPPAPPASTSGSSMTAGGVQKTILTETECFIKCTTLKNIYGLDIGTTVSAKVKAKNSIGASEWSNVATSVAS